MGLSQIGLKVMGILSMGRIKANRFIINPPLVVSAEITHVDPDKVAITFNQALDPASIPATTAFVIAGKVISAVSIVASDVILTVTVSFDWGDVVTVDYVKPLVNMLKSSIDGGEADSFNAQSVTNNITYPLILDDGKTIGWYDYLDASTLTVDGALKVSQWRDKLGGIRTLTTANVLNQPVLNADGVLFSGSQQGLSAGAFAFNQPAFFYYVLKQITWTTAEALGFGNSGIFTGMLAQRTSSPNIAAYAGSYSSLNPDMTLDTFVIVRVLFNGANSKLQVNNNVAITGNFGTGAIGGLNMATIEGNVTSNTSSHISVKGLIARNNADSSGDETKIYNYLKSKYGL